MRSLRARELLNSRFASVKSRFLNKRNRYTLFENSLSEKAAEIGPAVAGTDSAAGA